MGDPACGCPEAGHLFDCCVTIDAKDAEIAKLRVALDRYGRHDRACIETKVYASMGAYAAGEAPVPHPRGCPCGFAAAGLVPDDG